MANVLSPLVATSKTYLLRTYKVAKLVQDWKTCFSIDISGELSGIEEISLYRCELSQLDFFAPPSAAGSDQLYETLEKFQWFYMQEKWEFEQAIKDLIGSKKILEVGCGPGFFVEKATEALKGSVVKGIELSKSSLQRALQKNLPVERVDLLELVARGEIFDAVCGFQVLEHVHQPRDLLQAMVQILAPGGKLILCVPNKDSFLRYQYNLLDMPPHHMTRWNANTLRFLQKLFPLRACRISCEPLARYHISGYVAAYGRYLCTRLPIANRYLSRSRLNQVSDILEKTGLYRFLRGQSLYVAFEKL